MRHFVTPRTSVAVAWLAGTFAVVGLVPTASALHVDPWIVFCWSHFGGYIIPPIPPPESHRRTEAAYQGKPIPNGAEQLTASKFQSQKLEWLRGVYRTCYDTHGTHSPAWDNDVHAFLDEVCRRFTGDMSAPLLSGLATQALELTTRGCTDPLVRYCQGNLVGFTDGAAKAEPLVRQAMEALEASPYPRGLCAQATARCGQLVWNVRGSKAAAELAQIKTKLVRQVIAGTAEAVFFTNGANPRFYATGLLEYWDRMECWGRTPALTDAARADLALQVLADTADAEPWIADLVRGEAYTAKAWAARGSGWASTVTEEGWGGFKEELAQARKALLAAYEAHPEFPEAAARMIQLSMAGADEHSPREWFDRAVAAQMDDALASQNLQWALRPRWGGSHEEMYALGLDCLKTGRFDTTVPHFYDGTLKNIAADISSMSGKRAVDGARELFRRPGVIEDVQTYCRQALAHESSKGRELSYRTLELLAGLMATRPDIVQKAGTAPDNAGLVAQVLTDFGLVPAEVELELKAATGRFSTNTLSGWKLLGQGDSPGGVAALASALADCQDREEYRFIQTRLADLDLEPPWETAQALADIWIAAGRLELLARKYWGSARQGHTTIPESLTDNVRSALSPCRFALSGIVPRDRHGNRPPVEEQLAQVDRTLAELRGTSDAPTQEAEAMFRNMVELEILAQNLPGDNEGNRKVAEADLIPRVVTLPYDGRVMDFLAEAFRESHSLRRVAYLVIHRYFLKVVVPHLWNPTGVRQQAARLAGIQDPAELTAACSESFLHQGGGHLLSLQVAHLLRSRNMAPKALPYEEHAMRWLDTMAFGLPAAWMEWYRAGALNHVGGFEDDILQIGQQAEAKKSDHGDSFSYYMAEACMRKGRVDDAVAFFVDGVTKEADQSPFSTPLGDFKNSASYRNALLVALAAMPDLSEPSRTRLLGAFPDAAKIAGAR